MLFWISLMGAQAQEVWTIPELRNLTNAENIQEVIVEFPQIALVQFSTEKNTICLDGVVLTAKREDLIQRFNEDGYTVTDRTSVEKCISDEVSLWSSVSGDVVIVSTGERFSMRKSRAKEKYTIFDFGAIWCPPCQGVVHELQPIVEVHPQVAVRAVDLGADPTTSFDNPVVFQYLSGVEAIPWLILMDPKGKKIYQGSDVKELVKLLPPL